MKLNKHGNSRVEDLNMKFFKLNHAVYLLLEENNTLTNPQLAEMLDRHVSMINTAIRQLSVAGYIKSVTMRAKGIVTREVEILKPLTLTK